MADRTPRTLETREVKARAVYAPPSALPDPTPEPGYVYRWVATHVLGVADHTNASRKMREGWVPVKAADHPELMLAGNAKTGNVEIGGLMLCKMPEENSKARDEYYAQQTQMQLQSVDNHYMRNEDPRMRLFTERSSQVTRGERFGSGS